MGKIELIEPKDGSLMDSFFYRVNVYLGNKLPWLENRFGRAKRLVRHDADNRRIYFPGVYVRGKDYVNVFPDQSLGNYCFWVVDDPQEFKDQGAFFNIKCRVSLIVWFNMKRMGEDSEAVKNMVLEELRHFFIKNGKFTPLKSYDLAENILKGFTFTEEANQFLIYPYSGFRIEGDLNIFKSC